MQQSILDWSKQSTQLFMSVLTVFLIMAICFADKLPIAIRWQLSTSVGRLLLVLILYMIYLVCGWLMAFLFAIAIALTWAAAPILKPVSVQAAEAEAAEGFKDVKKTSVTGHKWFVESVLHENPTKIVEDRIDTQAIQDDSTRSGRTSR